MLNGEDGKQNKLKEYFSKHKTQLQFVIFTAFSFLAFLSQLLTQLLLGISLSGLVQTVRIWPFAPQPLGAFIAFLVANVVAKVLSYVLNRKKTFNANNNAAASVTIYVIMVVTLVIVETVIGTPLGAAIYRMLGGTYSGELLNAETAANPSLYHTSNTLSIMVYSFFDGIIVFLMDKFVIMRHKEKSDS